MPLRTPRVNAGRDETMAQLLAAGVKPTDAYTQAGFTAKNADCLRAQASQKRRRLAQRVAEIVGTNLLPKLKAMEGFQADVGWCREKLHELINDKDTPAHVRLGAIKECLNRGLGLPVQYVEQNVNVRYQITDQPMSEDEWFAAYAKPVAAIGPGNGSTEH